MRTSEVVVVGGGAIGASVAFFLAREGVEVTLLERDALAAGASGAAAGMLTPSGETDGDGPFFPWAQRSLEAFEGLTTELLERSGVDAEFVRCGTLRLAFDEAGAEGLKRRRERLVALGANLAWLEPEEVVRLEPQVAPGCFGGLLAPEEAHVRSPLLARAYASAATRLGARIETGVEATGLRVASGRVAGVETRGDAWSTPRVILCAGAWSRDGGVWPEGLALPPVEPVRGQIISVDAPTPAPTTTLLGGGGYVVPKRDGSLVIGATEERVGFDARVTGAGLRQLLEIGTQILPAIEDCTFRSAWAGLRPASPDGLPLIGPVREVDGLAVATGHYRNGVLLSPITGELIADWVAGKESPKDAEAFLPDRFASA